MARYGKPGGVPAQVHVRSLTVSGGLVVPLGVWGKPASVNGFVAC
jgi:hypothetical protein